MIALFLVLFFTAIGLGTWRGFDHSAREIKFIPSRGLPFYASSLLFLLLGLSWTTVDAGSVGVVKRFGNPKEQLAPGAHLVVPFADTVTRIAVQTRIVKPEASGASHDLQKVHAQVTLAYHVDPSYATSVLIQLNDDAEARVIDPAIMEAIKAVTAQFDAEQLITMRPKVRDQIEAFVSAKLLPYHLIPETVSITNFDFGEEFNHAIEAKVTAQQNALKATNDLTRIKVEAEQKIATAQAEAASLRTQREVITPELLQLRTVEMFNRKWDGKMPDVVVIGNGTGSVPLLNLLQKK